MAKLWMQLYKFKAIQEFNQFANLKQWTLREMWFSREELGPLKGLQSKQGGGSVKGLDHLRLLFAPNQMKMSIFLVNWGSKAHAINS